MKSLEILEELNKILIDAEKRCDIVYDEVGEQDKLRSDIDHDLLNNYQSLTAKEKREYAEKYFQCLADRHNFKYEYRELEILKELRNLQGLETAFNQAINKLRKLNQEQETPIYYKRAKQNKGEIIQVGNN
jgi:hypothetical protein